MNGHPSQQSGHIGPVGSLRCVDGKAVVHIETCLEAGIDEVWSALVDPGRLARWLGSFEGALHAGGHFQARFFASEWQGSGRVEACDPTQHLLVVSLTETGSADAQVMEAKLLALGEQTALTVEERGMPREQLTAYGAGVQVHVEDLASHLAGGERCDAQRRWKELFPTYSAMPIGS